MKLRICHLYGNLLNTYGDNGNLLMLQYVARQLGHEVETTIVSLKDPFVAADYDLLFVGGGQDHEQMVIAKDLPSKRDELVKFIEDGGAGLAICGGYQLLGQYYETADGEKIDGLGALPHYTLRQIDNRFIGDIEIRNERLGETFKGFENHNGRTFLGDGEEPLGRVVEGFGNNGEDGTEGAIYKNIFCSYFHGPLLVRNRHLAKLIIETAVKQAEN
ncbi:MAG: glutamine amidotransferase [Peptococcaceae bacterium]|nr:glutamine amidotransferase [Peptococcaceae bacterium]